MPTAQHLRAQIEATLADKIPSALTPLPPACYSLVSTGVREIDELLHGGLPAGAISEIVGPECSGRTSLALALVAGMTRSGKVCAWVDVSDTLHPESAAAIGVDLARMLWIRCGASSNKELLPLAPPKAKPGLPQGGGGHPRMEVRGLSAAVSDLLAPRCAETQHKLRPQPKQHEPQNDPPQHHGSQPAKKKTTPLDRSRSKSWWRLEQALRVTDLLLQAGGFSCIVLDMGSLNAEFALRVPLATWFRFRAAAERLQANVLMLTQHACAKSSAALVLRLDPGGVLTQDSTIFTGLEHQTEVERFRNHSGLIKSARSGFPWEKTTESSFASVHTNCETARQRSAGNILPLRKPPQSVHTAQWQAPWAGRR